MNLQRRVASALVALVAVFVVAQGTVAYVSLEEQEDRLADEAVQAEARQLAGYAQRGDLDGVRAGDILDRGGDLEAWLVRRDGEIAPPTLPAELGDLPEGMHRVVSGHRPLHVAVVGTQAGRLVVSYDAQRSEEEVRQYGRYLLGLGVLSIAAAVAMARWIARIVVGPMERLARRLGDWVPGEAGEHDGASDEEARLLAAFRRVQARFEQAIARERTYSANLEHELRTPLAALRTDLEMLEGTDALPAPQRARAQRMLAAVDAIVDAIRAAGALSRTAPRHTEQVDLARCVDDAWLTLEPTAQQRGLVLENRIEPGVVADVDRHALLTILRNLLRNAAEHAAPARCVVDGDAAALSVEDDGPGVPADELPLVFERAWHGARTDLGHPDAPVQQRGLGLAIGREIAELNGWTLSVHAVRPHGLRFVLHFGGG